MAVSITWLLPMNFPNRLAKIRKSRGLTQQALAEAAGLHISQVRRYKTGSAQPTLEGLIKLARSLHVSLDELMFEDHERGPAPTAARCSCCLRPWSVSTRRNSRSFRNCLKV